METNDDKLFSKSAPLLAAASELAFHTVNCSALNAEELRRENGIQVIYRGGASGIYRGGVAQWVVRLTRNQAVVSSHPIKGSCCFLERELK